MQAHELSSRWRAAVLLGVVMVALFALVACGSDDEDTPVAGAPPTQAPAPTVTAAPTATPIPEPPAAPMTPATAPEPGSDEEQIMAVLDKQVRAVNTADYVAIQETCTPSAKKLPPLSRLKFVYEVNLGVFHGEGNWVRFSPQGYNVRNVEVKMLRAPFAQASFETYDYDEYVGRRRSLQTFEKVDGQWYSESAPCKQG